MAETTKRPNGVRSYIADTLALLLFFTTTGINQRALHRRHDMGASLARTPLGGVLMLAVGRPCGLWRDSMMSHSKASRFSQILWDSAALMSFQVPIYAAIVVLSGATGTGPLMGILGAA